MIAKSWALLPLAVYSLFADSGAGLAWTTPPDWKAQAARPMRLATYKAGDQSACGVYYFGAGQGGSVQANLTRWIRQFQQPNGVDPEKVAKVQTQTIHGIKVTTVDVSGAYTGMGGPMAAGGPAMPGFRLLGAIAEGPEGSIFFKFTGPAKTVAANTSGFEIMIHSLHKL